MSYILHSSVAVSWVLPTKSKRNIKELCERAYQEPVFVPVAWSMEICDSLLHALRDKAIDVNELDRCRNMLDGYPVEVDSASKKAFAEVLDIADHYRITTHEAAYIELAQRQHLPLAVLSSGLRKICASASIPVLL